MTWNPYALTDQGYREVYCANDRHGEWADDIAADTTEPGAAAAFAAQFDVPICHNPHPWNAGTYHPCASTQPCSVHTYLERHKP